MKRTIYGLIAAIGLAAGAANAAITTIPVVWITSPCTTRAQMNSAAESWFLSHILQTPPGYPAGWYVTAMGNGYVSTQLVISCTEQAISQLYTATDNYLGIPFVSPYYPDTDTEAFLLDNYYNARNHASSHFPSNLNGADAGYPQSWVNSNYVVLKFNPDQPPPNQPPGLQLPMWTSALVNDVSCGCIWTVFFGEDFTLTTPDNFTIVITWNGTAFQVTAIHDPAGHKVQLVNGKIRPANYAPPSTQPPSTAVPVPSPTNPNQPLPPGIIPDNGEGTPAPGDPPPGGSAIVCFPDEQGNLPPACAQAVPAGRRIIAVKPF